MANAWQPPGEVSSPSADHSSSRGDYFSNRDTAGRKRETVMLSVVLLIALALRLWGLGQNGWGAEYYSAAVRSMALNWHNFFFCSFDPAGFISVDKPPVALWLQVASVKLFGYRPLSVLLPQVLEGLASIWFLFHIVRRHFSASAALLAAFFFAITPVFVAVNRTNNTDSCLVLGLLAAAWVFLKAMDRGRRYLLLLSMALIGLAFNIKMLAGFIVLPTFFMVYLIGAPLAWRRRSIDLAMAALVLIAASVPWVLAYELTPADRRPFIGGSSHNSMTELLVGYNGIGRFVKRAKRPDAAAGSPAAMGSAVPGVQGDAGGGSATGAVQRSVLSRLYVRAPAGPLRLLDGQLAAQTGWLLPMAVMALVFGIFQGQPRGRPAPAQLELLFWSCWIITYAAVYSYAGGIMHFYYLATMAPALSALAGIGLAGLWDSYRKNSPFTVLLPLTLLATAAWELYIQADALGWTPAVIMELRGDWRGWLCTVLAAGTLMAVIVLFIVRRGQLSGRLPRSLAKSSLAMGLASLLAVPAAWALSCVLLPGQGILPSADLYRLEPVTRQIDARVLGRFGRIMDTSRLVGFLKANRTGEHYLLATTTAQLAAPIIINTGENVMAMGGFHGLDPAVSPDKLARMVKAKQVRFVMIGDMAIASRRMGGPSALKNVSDWVKSNGRPVDPALWRYFAGRDNMALYDLMPGTVLVQALPGLP